METINTHDIKNAPCGVSALILCLQIFFAIYWPVTGSLPQRPLSGMVCNYILAEVTIQLRTAFPACHHDSMSHFMATYRTPTCSWPSSSYILLYFNPFNHFFFQKCYNKNITK